MSRNASNPFSIISAKAIVAERERIAAEAQQAEDKLRLQGRNALLTSSKLPALLNDIVKFFMNGGHTYRHMPEHTRDVLDVPGAVPASTPLFYLYLRAAHEALIEGLSTSGFHVQEEDESDVLWVTLP